MDEITDNLISIIKSETSKKLMKENDLRDRFRLFTCVLYDETTDYNIDEVLRNIKSYKNYAFIKHDKDINVKGEIKKTHYHCIVKVDNATTISAISKKIGIPDNYVKNVRNERSMVRYLVHIDDKDKYQYDIKDICSSKLYDRTVSKCFDDLESESEQLANIYNFINHISEKTDNKHNGLYLLIQYVNSNCYDTIYKRYRYEIKDYLDTMF